MKETSEAKIKVMVHFYKRVETVVQDFMYVNTDNFIAMVATSKHRRDFSRQLVNIMFFPYTFVTVHIKAFDTLNKCHKHKILHKGMLNNDKAAIIDQKKMRIRNICSLSLHYQADGIWI